MTATSRARRRPMRLFSMESLGFIEPPDQSWSTPAAHPVPGPVSLEASSQTTELFEIPVGRHTTRQKPSGELIKDIWDSTELHAPSLIDWEPQTISTQELGRRDVRWRILVPVAIVVLGAVGLGYWMLTRPDSVAAAAMAVVEGEAEHLTEAFDLTAPLVADLDAERLPPANQDSTVFLSMGEAARTMFAASADLPASDEADRTAAAEAAGLALDASRQLMDATAYRTALEPALTLPLLETDPALTDLETATAAFTEWRAGFESVHEALPTGMTGNTAAALDEVSAGLEAVQTRYLDALRTGDRAAAVEALGGLRAQLVSIRSTLLADLGTISESVTGLIEEARARMARLLG